MLSDIRERFTGKPALVVLGVLAFSFVFFGIGEFTFLGGAYAAKVDDTEISVNQLQRAYQNQLLQYSDYGNMPAESRQILKVNSLERLIRDTLVELHVRDEGYRISDVQIAEIIQSEPEFQDNGVFSKDAYYSWLDVRALNARTFEAQQARSIRTGQLLRGIGATAFVTASEYRRYLNLYAEQRQATIAVFDIAALADTVVVHDEDVSAYYDARPDDFNTPESVDFEYLEINRAELSQEIEIDEDVLQRYYEDSGGRFLQDEQRQARHILITVDDGDEDAAEQQAVALTARIQAGEPFEDLARQYSKDGGTANTGGDLGVVMQSQMPGALGSAIFTMTAGEVLGPVRTDFGFHIVRLDSILDGGPLPLEQIRNELLQELRSQGVEVRARELTRQLSDALFDASELQSVSASSGLAVQAVTGFSRTGGEPFGDNQAVIEAVFDPRTLLEGQISDLIDVDVNRSVMIRVTQHHEQARQPLAEVRESIEFALQSERAVNMIEDRSRRLVEALEAGRDFAEIANELEATYTPNVVVGRRDDSVDRAVLNAIFRTKKPAPGIGRLGSIVSTVGDYAVFMVTAVIPGRPESVSLAERDRRKEELQAQAGNADLNAFVTELMRNADIERNQDVLSGSDILQ